jgi:hypothetical protein
MFSVLLFSLVAVLVGLAFTFAGYRFFRMLLPLWAFFSGLFFGIQAFDSLMGGGFLATAFGVILGIIVGLILAAIAYFAYSFAVVLYGASLGYSLGYGLMLLIGLNPGFIPWFFGIVVSVLFVVLFMALRMPTFFVVFGTALGGSMAVIMGLFVLFGRVPVELASLRTTNVLVSDSWIWLIIWLVLAGIGMASQYTMEKDINLMKEYSVKV